jgi:hypothetical protein
MTAVASPLRLFHRRAAQVQPVTARSLALFRLGEACNHRCPMCSNSGRPEAFFIQPDELLRRADFLHSLGFRRVVLTGGEPTIHPGLRPVVERLRGHGMSWDANTHGRKFADPEFTAWAVESGLHRAIVSLHSHEMEASCIVSGIAPAGHAEVVAGIGELCAAGVRVVVNCVLTAHLRGKLLSFLQFCRARWGGEVAVKAAFPSTSGKGGGWDGIQLRYADMATELRQALAWAEAEGLDFVMESVPPCVVGDTGLRNVSRSGFGETHYLDDITGDRVYPIRAIEAALSVHGEVCRGCRALDRCPGVSADYASRHGLDELCPL